MQIQKKPERTASVYYYKDNLVEFTFATSTVHIFVCVNNT